MCHKRPFWANSCSAHYQQEWLHILIRGRRQVQLQEVSIWPFTHSPWTCSFTARQPVLSRCHGVCLSWLGACAVSHCNRAFIGVLSEVTGCLFSMPLLQGVSQRHLCSEGSDGPHLLALRLHAGEKCKSFFHRNGSWWRQFSETSSTVGALNGQCQFCGWVWGVPGEVVQWRIPSCAQG